MKENGSTVGNRIGRKRVMSNELSKMKSTLMDHEERLVKLEKLLQTKPEVVKKKLSIREFIMSKNPESEMERTVTIAYYLEMFGSLTSFSVKDLESGFRKAKEKIPRNINYEVIRCIQKGYLMEAEEKKDKRKTWCLTNTGLEFVEKDFADEK